MYYGDDVIEEVRAANDIVDVISGYVRLKKQGANYFGLCPFHNEKSPSFSVSGNKQLFKCFGCGAGGNVYTFVMQYESCDFQEAVQMLAKRAGVNLPEAEMSEERKKAISKRNRMLEVTKAAATYYYAALRSEAGGAGFNYLQERKLSSETMQRFGLGFAPQNSKLIEYLRGKGFDNAIIRETGLATADEKHGMYDRFWNRVIYPIMDVNNKVVAFGGRVMGDAKPKYLNSPESDIFHKNVTLYALNKAKQSKSEYFIICEGYMDAITLHQAGFDQAVATCGTALTTGHIPLLRKYKQEVRLIFDSDEAGIKAALRAIPICRAGGIIAQVVDLKPYKDPDEFIKNLGAQEFQNRLDNAENSLYFELRMEERRYNMSDPDGRTAFLKNAAKRISLIEDEIERNSYIQAVAAKYMMKPESMESEVARAAAKNEGITNFERPRSGQSTNGEKKEDGNFKAQRLLITSLIENPQIYSQLKKYLAPEDFDDGVSRRTAQLLYEQLEEGKLNPAAIISLFEDLEEQKQVSQMLSSKLGELETKSEKEKYISELVVKIRRNSIDRSLRNPTAVGGANAYQDIIETRRLMDELKKIHIALG